MLDASNAIHPQLQEEMNLDNTELERAVEQVDCCCFMLSCWIVRNQVKKVCVFPSWKKVCLN